MYRIMHEGIRGLKEHPHGPMDAVTKLKFNVEYSSEVLVCGNVTTIQERTW